MALVLPGKPRGVSFKAAGGVKVRKPMHPAIGLLCGFAILLAVAMVVHLVFGLMF